MPQLSFDRYSFVIDGQPTIIRSAALHYFRLPSTATWRDRLIRLKQAGYNTVDLYFNWAAHSLVEGVYDFTGTRNIGELLRLAESAGLWVIARPGPYINAELSGGGFPNWLLAKPDIRLRHRTALGNFEWCHAYAKAVEEWWLHILPFIRDCQAIIAMQVENEYATVEAATEPITSLIKLARDMGITVPLFHNDLYAAGLYADCVDLYAFDHYPLTYFDQEWRGQAPIFSLVDSLESQLRPFCEQRPLFIAECQTGWFAGWTGPDDAKLERSFGREFLPMITKSLLAQGVTVFNHYLAVGGTNLHFLGAVDSHTSYDFAAPISEAGFNRASFYEAKTLNQFLDSFSVTRTEPVSGTVLLHPEGHGACWLTTRRDLTHPDAYWVFYRNNNFLPTHWMVQLQDTSLAADALQELLPLWPQTDVHLSAQEAVILPLNVPLINPNWRVVWSSTECFYQSTHVLMVKAHHIACLMLAWQEPVPLPEETDGLLITLVAGQGVVIRCQALSIDKRQVTLGDLTIFFLSQPATDTCWVQPDGLIVMGPSASLPDDQYTLASPHKEVSIVSPMGSVTREKGFFKGELPPLPVLAHWKTFPAAPELYEPDLMKQPCALGSDLDSLGYYEGSAWYGMTLHPPYPRLLHIQARHGWAIFVNGVVLAQGQQAPIDPVVEPVTVTFPAVFHKSVSLVILVDSLGHPKGFQDDPRLPQGLLSLKLDDQDVSSQLHAAPGFSSWQAPLKRLFGMLPDESPVIRAETHFSLQDYSPFHWALLLDVSRFVKNRPDIRINIKLNHQLIGRYWQKNQTRFLLPPGILHQDKGAENHLELVCLQPKPCLSCQQLARELPTVQLVLCGAHTRINI